MPYVITSHSLAEDTTRAQSRATAITRKISGFAEVAEGELVALRAEAVDLLFVFSHFFSQMRSMA